MSGGADVRIDPPDRTKPVEHTFQLHNPTANVIHVRKVWDGCVCVASKLDSPDVQPGQTVPLVFRIKTLDAYAPTYAESVRVETDKGDLDLTISGRLPLPTAVMYRPQIVYLEALPEQTKVERSVMVRVPKQCCREFHKDDVQMTGCSGVKVELTEDPPSELYREFTIRVVAPAEHLDTAAGTLRLNTGCEWIEVGIRPSTR